MLKYNLHIFPFILNASDTYFGTLPFHPSNSLTTFASMLKYCATLRANADQQNANNLLSNKCMQGGGDVIFCLSAYGGDLYPLRFFLFLFFCAWMRTHASSLLLSSSYLQPYLTWSDTKIYSKFFFLFVTDCVIPPPIHTHTHTHLWINLSPSMKHHDNTAD